MADSLTPELGISLADSSPLVFGSTGKFDSDTRRRNSGVEQQTKSPIIDGVATNKTEKKEEKAIQPSFKPLSGLIQGFVVSGGLSRSPAFDCLPVISHWAERTGESSSEDPAASVCLSSTWETSHVLGQGATMANPLGAPCWSLKNHGLGPVEAGSSKFSQRYDAETDTLVTTVNLERRSDTSETEGTLSIARLECF
ncbi:hypothetical protein O1611_g10389 [Lasiodiplodia mahajangana]|uniref:Uncharacterized protein n=1 Tax=Lasiodiplodia mahajangana TaxID=1108764 RepID=A0ACC2IYQ0_9PEZI|nr:hypothetical protein O1611_g10389 [Lasiodiplodia mahajangana]